MCSGMGIMETIKTRRSIRAYSKKKAIDNTTLEQILEAGRLAPSAKNLQEWKFVVVRDKNILTSLIPACKGQEFVGDASAVVVGCSDEIDHVMTSGQPSYPIDLAIAIDHMSLMAAEFGIGSCWIGAFYEGEVKKLLSIPKNVRVVNLLTLGYPEKELHDLVITKQRKKISEIVCYDKWSF